MRGMGWLSAWALTLTFACVGLPRAVRAAEEHPIAGVITLLERLEVQAKTEGEHEAHLYQKFSSWCSDSERALARAVKNRKAAVASLNDKADGLRTRVATLSKEMKSLKEDIEQQTANGEQMTQMREKEREEYLAEKANLKSTISAVDKTVAALEESQEQVEELVQMPRGTKPKAATALRLASHIKPAPHRVQAGKHPALHHKALVHHRTVVHQASRKKEEPEEMEEHVGDFHSGAVIETFEEMETDFVEDKVEEKHEEINKQNAYNLAKQALDFAIKTATEAREEKGSIKAEKESALADITSAKEQEESTLAADLATLEDTRTTCKTKAAEWAQRSDIRNGEVEALGMAQKILAKVIGVRNPDTHTVPSAGLMEASAMVLQDTTFFRKSFAFLQVVDPKTRAINLLKSAAQKTHSKSLLKLAREIQSFKGPFDSIKNMMQKMIFRLMADQTSEDNQKNWCEQEEEKSQESKAAKTEKIEYFEDKMGEMSTKVKQLTMQIADNDRALSDIAKYTKEETEMRDENHKEILATVKDSEDAMKAVTQAVAVLTDFYKKTGMVAKEPWEFLQRGTRGDPVELPENPATWDASYTGTADPADPGGGVLAILDGVNEKFSKMAADAKAQDVTDQREYDVDMAAKKQEVAEKEMDSRMKKQKVGSLQEKLDGMAPQLKATKSEKAAIVTYLKDLEPACGTGDSSFEDRKKARLSEIEALRTAQNTLEEAFRAK